MDVRVKTVNVKGRQLKGLALKAAPSHPGTLRLREDRMNLLSRAVMRAEVRSTVDGVEATVLPPLVDAQLIWLDGKELRLRGIEVVDDVQYAQTWIVEVLRCSK